MSKQLNISFILDETGSMMAVKQQTISGFNEYISTLKADKKSKNARFTLTKFNSGKVEIVHNGVLLGDVIQLNDENYQPDNLTPLYDAIGKTISSIEAGKKKGNVLVVIQTDGEENASKEYDRQRVFDLIDKKKKNGWTFAFLGADQDAYLASGLLGIAATSTMSYAGSNTKQAFRSVATATINYAHTDGSQTDKFFDDSK